MPAPADTFPSEVDRERRLERLRTIVAQPPCSRETPGATPISSTLQSLLGESKQRFLIDCLAAGAFSGAGLVALWLCRQACQQRGELVVIDHAGTFYPPSAAAWGVDARRLLVVSPSGHREALAAAELALRSPAVGAVWARLERIDGRSFRRLLLASEAGEALGTLIRSDRHEPDPSWGDVQLKFTPVASPSESEQPLLIRVTQTRNRRGRASGDAMLSIDWRTGKIEDITPTENAA